MECLAFFQVAQNASLITVDSTKRKYSSVDWLRRSCHQNDAAIILPIVNSSFMTRYAPIVSAIELEKNRYCFVVFCNSISCFLTLVKINIKFTFIFFPCLFEFEARP